jgi:hypothetical protein
MIDYPIILSINYVGKQWTLNGNSYDGLIWLDSSPKPTQAELDALWESTQATVRDKAQAKIDAKQAALNKLMALGLTEEEALALGK